MYQTNPTQPKHFWHLNEVSTSWEQKAFGRKKSDQILEKMVAEVWCCILTSDTAKHAIPKTAEVAYSVGQLWEEIA